MSNTYDLNSIKSLSFRDGVRKRVSMYLGTDDNDGTYQALKEIINNATDEALAGYGNKIEIGVDEGQNAIRVRDYGRGVPFGIRENGENVLVSIYTKSHTGGKFDDSSYKTAAGLNGIGGSCVCLSSSWFDVYSYRDGKMAHANFQKGVNISYEETNTKLPNGTIVEFSPDPEVFKNGKIGYSFEKICQDIENLSYLYPQVEFILQKTNKGNVEEVKKFHSTKGIINYIENHLDTPLNKNIIFEETNNGEDSVQIAFQWGTKYETNVVFANGLECPEGGVPITGAKTAITRTLNNLAGTDFDGELIRKNLFYVINCKVQNPSFANQTKSKINNASLRGLTSEAFTKGLTRLKEEFPSDFNLIIEYLSKISKAEQAAERARKQVLETTREIENETRKRTVLADKLKDCQKHGPNSGSVLAICEGDSALGALVKARPIDNVALIPIRGKIISALKHEQEKILQNEEVKAIFSALGCGFFNKYNSNKLRYQYVGLAVDADKDGSNIACLIIALLYYMCPQFLQEGRLLWLRMPLFVLKYGKDKILYAFDEKEKDEYIKKYGKPKEMSRKKGIGENTPEETRTSVFGEQKKWEQLVIKNDEEFNSMIQMLMGKEVEERKHYIMDNVDFSLIGE